MHEHYLNNLVVLHNLSPCTRGGYCSLFTQVVTWRLHVCPLWCHLFSNIVQCLQQEQGTGIKWQEIMKQMIWEALIIQWGWVDKPCELHFTLQPPGLVRSIAFIWTTCSSWSQLQQTALSTNVASSTVCTRHYIAVQAQKLLGVSKGVAITAYILQVQLFTSSSL